MTSRTFSDLRWCRYADDGLVHCRSEMEAQIVREALQARLVECRLELHLIGGQKLNGDIVNCLSRRSGELGLTYVIA